jgi:hypothetical protein
MAEIKCPHCGTVFTVDEAGYAAVAAQVRGLELDKEAREKAEYLSAEKDAEITKLHMQLEALQEKAEAELKALKEKKETEIDALKNSTDKDVKLAVTEALADKEKELSELKLSQIRLEEGYKAQLSAKDSEIAFYKDFKAKESTKMIGENLEQHCMTEFNKLRAAAFKNAYFDKDNDASSGSKGDFIFRDFDEDGTEYVSIMFEMKNEMDTTSTKKKNSDFFKELDKDRREKDCEYAVLVSMLEADSELYNSGIVDVSHEYPKMYVIRPQFFIPMITILRNANQNTLSYRKQLIEQKTKNADLNALEDNINDFKAKFGNNFRLASEHYEKAIDSIDKTIKNLEKTRDELVKSMKNLKWANDKAEDLSLEMLTKDIPGLEDHE